MNYFKTHNLLLLVIIFNCYLYAQTYTDDSIAVRAILDSNNITTYSVSDVSDVDGGRIVKLNLNFKITKMLPADIGKLTALVLLGISNNAELSSLPNELENLKSLENFHCDYCDVSIFPIVLTKITSLTHLRFTYNNTEIIPDEIGNLSNLTSLYLSGNNIKTIPASICQLSNLNVLNLFKNPLITIPDSIGKLINLIDLKISGSNLTQIPESIGNLINLSMLGITNSKFLEQIPESIGNLKNLRYLYLSKNKLKSLPSTIGDLSNLYYLSINYNELINLPNGITKYEFDNTTMQTLFLDSNYLNPETVSPNVKLWLIKNAGTTWANRQRKLTNISNKNTPTTHPPQISINNEVLKLYLPKDDFISFYLYNASGQQVLKQYNQFFFQGKHNINIGNISSFVGNGTYIMVLKSETKNKTYSSGKITLF